ncbi:UNVERIFIED_ORG: hypothetical protein E4P37_17890, partial [Bacillus sp. AZ43]
MTRREAGARSALRRLRLRLLPLPGQAVGLALLVAVLAAALVSAPLFVASAEQGAWEQEQDRISRASLGATVLATTVGRRGGPPTDRIQRSDEFDTAVAEAAAAAGLGRPEFFVGLREDLGAFTGAGGGAARLASLAGAGDHLEIVAGSGSGDGVLVPQSLADRAGVGPGDSLTLATEAGGTAVVPVTGVYVPPVAPLEEFWEGLGFLFLPTLDQTSGDLVFPPAAVLAPQERTQAVAVALGVNLDMEWTVPLDEATPIGEARATVDRYERLQAVMTNPDGPLAGVVQEGGFETAAVRTSLPNALESVDRTVELLEPPVRAVGIGGGAAALVLVGAWAGHRMRRRDDELRSLVARGLSPVRAAGDVVR